MATTWKEGDRVQITERNATNADEKSGLYYAYFGGLTGVIQKVYPTEEVAVEVELASLDETVERRHTDMQEQMKAKWLEELSEVARTRLSDKEREFRLRYTILVHRNDLAQPKSAPIPASATARLTSDDLNAKEEEEIQRRLGR